MGEAEQVTEPVLCAAEDGIARLTINRPDKRNALSLAVVDRMLFHLRALESDPSIRVAILTGAGDKAFAAGADLDELQEAFATVGSARAYDDHVTRLYVAMEASRLPIIARMAGSAIGGGCLLALACDLRVAASHVEVGFPVARLGLMLSPHEYRLLLDHLSLSQAKGLLLTGRRLKGDDATAMGLVDVVTSADRLDDQVHDLARTIVAGAPLALAASKRLLNAISRHSGVAEAASGSYRTIYPSRDLTEGLAALRARRQPHFVGR